MFHGPRTCGFFAAILVVAMAIFVPERATADAVVTEPPNPPQLTYAEYLRDDLQARARVSRNALIGTSAAAVVGAALYFPGILTQCVEAQRFDGTTDTECTAGGQALVGIGLPLLIGGASGALITGILLGVRKRKIRRLEDEIRSLESRKRRTRRLGWDVEASRATF